MRTQGDILLISCYELGHQPLGIGWPSSFLRHHGYKPTLIDTSICQLGDADIEKARIVCLSVPMHTALRLGINVAKKIRTINPGCHICFIGLYANLNSEYLLSNFADTVIGGETEEDFLLLVKHVEQNSKNETGDVFQYKNSSEPVLRRLNFPDMNREGMKNIENYAKLVYEGNERKVGHVEASRGCKHVCAHCPVTPVYQGRFFVIPQDVVLRDIDNLVESGAQHITFGDPDFLNGPGHSLAIVRQLHKNHPNLTYDFTAKVDHLLSHQDKISEFEETGCLFIITAVESLSDLVLTKLKKGHTKADIYELFELFERSSITLRPSLVPFTPWTTLEDYVDLILFFSKGNRVLTIDSVHFAIRLLIPPGSALLEEVSSQSYLEPLDQENFIYPWKHPDARIDKLHEEISEIVSLGSDSGQSEIEIFNQIARILAASSDLDEESMIVTIDGDAPSRPPRLTETWFCCAEPTKKQMSRVRN